VSAAILKRVRWIAGDFVTLDYDDGTSTFTMRRVDDTDGNALSEKGGNKGGMLTVRYSIDANAVPQLGLECGHGYDCDLVAVSGDSVLFKRS